MTNKTIHREYNRKGVVAVITQEERFLVIQRSDKVIAPGKICFPGGGIEEGETEQQAIIREIQEELQVDITLVHRLWESVTDWKIHLAWWQAEIAVDAQIAPNRDEVHDYYWCTLDQLAKRDDMLESMYEFVEEMQQGTLRLLS